MPSALQVAGWQSQQEILIALKLLSLSTSAAHFVARKEEGESTRQMLRKQMPNGVSAPLFVNISQCNTFQQQCQRLQPQQKGRVSEKGAHM